MTGDCTFKVFRGDRSGGELREYKVPVETGMVVLDAIHWIQAHAAPDLACRWNCKAARCGSCSAEINGRPKLMCKARLDDFVQGEPITVRPMKAFPVMKDLVTDVKSNYAMAKKIPVFTPQANASWKWYQQDIDRVQEFRKCIQCFLCQDVCHVLREHNKHDVFAGPAFFVQVAALEMHPIDAVDRTGLLNEGLGIGFCNITKCCTEVCPEDIHITDNANPREVNVMFKLKPLSKDAISKALQKADRYRLLNEPAEAESICLDILAAEPDNQLALVTLILALTDQFDRADYTVGHTDFQELLPRLRDDYERAYYSGVISERRAKASLRRQMHSSAAYEWFREAMSWYEKAEAIRPAGNDDAVLRWNTCARIFMHNKHLQPREEETAEPYLE